MAGFFKRLLGSSDEGSSKLATDEGVQDSSGVADVTVDITAYADGSVMDLAAVADQTFASGALGPGLAIDPSGENIVAPVDGVVTVAFPTGHAYGIRTHEGLELLIHIGFDTVELDGQFFTPRVLKGDTVKRGDVLVEFNRQGIQDAGYPLTTPLVVTNAKNCVRDMEVLETGGAVLAGSPLLRLHLTQ